MDDTNSMFVNEIQKCLDRLKVLLDGSEKYVNQFFEEMGNLKSEEEKKSEIETKSEITNYKKTFDYFNGKFEKLKVKFFSTYCQIFMYGKVSVGKSRIINAILRKDVFQSTVAHTTSCFVKICKSSDEHHYIEYGNNKETCDKLDDLKKRIKAISTEFGTNKSKLKTNELLSVYLNIPDNEILTSNTEIIDCPGSANKNSITDYIKDKALNANIFIFVLTTGITDEEKKFFQYQWHNSSKPIIFFLVNKWDQAYNDEDDAAEASKREITKGLIEFLTNQIKLSNIELENRIFFISALNICNKRNFKNGNSTIRDDYNEECCQFENFEKSLAQFIKTFEDEKSKYIDELDKLKDEIIKDTIEFKTYFQDKIYIENIEKFDKFLKDVETSSKEEVDKIRAEENNIKENCNGIKEFASNSERYLKQYKFGSVEKKFKNLRNQTENPILKLKGDMDDFISTRIAEYQELTGVVLQNESVKLKDMMKMEIKFKEVSPWKRLLKLCIDLFIDIKNWFTKGSDKNNSEVEKIINENIEQLNSAVHQLQENLSTNVNILIEHQKKEIGNIMNQLQLKTKVYDKFTKNMENLLE